MERLQMLGWIYIALVGGVFFTGIYIYTQKQRPWVKLYGPWLILISIFAEYSVAAMLQSCAMLVYSESNTVGRLEIIARALNFMAIFDIILMVIFMDLVRNNASRKVEKQMARFILIGKHLLFVFLPLYEDFLRHHYGLAMMIIIGTLGIPAIVRVCLGPSSSQDDQNVIERFVEFLSFTALWTLATNWVGIIIVSADFIPGGELAQMLPPVCILCMYFHTNRKMKKLFPAPVTNTADADVSFHGTNGTSEPMAQISCLTPNGYQTADLVPAPSRNNINHLMLDLESAEEEQREMNILEFMKSESARQTKESRERELISWRQFLKESARDPDSEEILPSGEFSQTVHAMIHHVEMVDEIEEPEVQGGVCQSTIPDDADPPVDVTVQDEEQEDDDKAESMSIESDPGELRYASPLSWQEIAVSPGRPVDIPPIALSDEEDEIGASKPSCDPTPVD